MTRGGVQDQLALPQYKPPKLALEHKKAHELSVQGPIAVQCMASLCKLKAQN